MTTCDLRPLGTAVVVTKLLLGGETGALVPDGDCELVVPIGEVVRSFVVVSVLVFVAAHPLIRTATRMPTVPCRKMLGIVSIMMRLLLGSCSEVRPDFRVPRAQVLG